MPELPEVQTTVNGLRKRVIGLSIANAWSDYNSAYYKGSQSIKDPAYFKRFRKQILGRKVVSVERRAKNILINLDAGKGGVVKRLTILVHMKMTGHLLYGLYRFDRKAAKDPWEPIEPASLKDSYNRRIHFMLTFDNGRNLALSDTRKFAKVAVMDSETAHLSEHLEGIGPEPVGPDFSLEKFSARLNLRPKVKIKQVLMDQTVIAGIGNIYADESLWRAGIHPLSRVAGIKARERKALYDAVRKTLSRGIDFGGDSMSDYRNVDGEKGKFQEKHMAYQRTNEKCGKLGCSGTIRRIVIGGRSTHYCDQHQRLCK